MNINTKFYTDVGTTIELLINRFYEANKVDTWDTKSKLLCQVCYNNM